MKKQLFLILLATSIIATAQNKTEFEETDSQKRMTDFSKKKLHYLSLDVGAALVFPAFNPRYEYAANKYSSIGADLNINFDNSLNSEVIEKFSFSPYYRQYFFSKEDFGAKGFYGEGFLKFYTYESSDYFYDNSVEQQDFKSYFESAIGTSVGWKWVSNTGFIIDLNIGFGRNFGLSNEGFLREFTGRFGINFGWRF